MFSWLPSPLTAIMVSLYFVLNLGLNYYNVYLLGGGPGQLHLPIPIFYTMLHQVTIVTFTAMWCLVVPSVRFPLYDTFMSSWKWLIFVSTIYAASIATNNGSFASISLTVNTIFKSAIPFPTMIFSYFIESKRYTIPIIAIVSILVAGTLLAVPWHAKPKPAGATPEWVGIVLVVISTLATAMRPVVSSHLMRSNAGAGGKPLTATAMAFWDALIAIPVLAVGSVVTDVVMRPGVQEVFAGANAMNNIGLISLGCLFAGVYGPVTFYTIKLTSSLSFVIIGNFKQLALLAGAALFVDKVSDPLLWTGVGVVALSTLAYSYQTNMEKRAAAELAAKKAATEATPLKKGVAAA